MNALKSCRLRFFAYVCMCFVSAFTLFGTASYGFAEPMGDVNVWATEIMTDYGDRAFWTDRPNTIPYCIETNFIRPSDGAHSTSRMTAANVNGHTSGSGAIPGFSGNWHNFCLVLYYGYGCQGYKQSNFSNFFDSSFHFLGRDGSTAKSYTGASWDDYFLTHYFVSLAYGHTWGMNTPHYKSYYDRWIVWANAQAYRDNVDVDKLEVYWFKQPYDTTEHQAMVFVDPAPLPPLYGFAGMTKHLSM